MREHDDITNAMKRHSNTVLRVCSLYFHGRPERDDAFQETFIKYAQTDKAFADDEHAKAWLIRVAANVCKDMLRRADAKAILTDRFDEDARPNWSSSAEAGNDRLDRLSEALQQLDDQYRIALYLKYYEGYTTAEIAEVLDQPEGTVYTNLTRGRAKLKEVLTHGER